MDDVRINALGFDDSPYDQHERGSKEQSKRKNAEPQKEPTDEVVLSDGSEEQSLGYSRASLDRKPK